MTTPDSAAAARSATLRNGLAVTLRPLRADDRDRIARAIRGLDRESIYTRLFSYRNELTEAGLDRVMKVDPEREVALVVTTGAGPEEVVIGAGRMIETGAAGEARKAEVAFTVEEDYHGLGIAGRLMQRFVEIARERGMAALEADVLDTNQAMLAVFGKTGLPMRRRRADGVVHVTLALQDERS